MILAIFISCLVAWVVGSFKLPRADPREQFRIGLAWVVHQLLCIVIAGALVLLFVLFLTPGT